MTRPAMRRCTLLLVVVVALALVACAAVQTVDAVRLAKKVSSCETQHHGSLGLAARAGDLANEFLLYATQLVCCERSLSLPAYRPTGEFIWGSLPENAPQTSQRYKRWLKLVRLGYEGGEAERALSAERGDVDRASVRLSRDYSGFHGLHCLSKGNCFGDPRQAVFRTPKTTSVPVAPPTFQEPPPVSSQAEAFAQKRADARVRQSLGVDYSADMLKRQRFNDQVPPHLDPFKMIWPKPEEVPHDREAAPLRGNTLGKTEKQDAFTSLMRTWLTTIRAPFHTKKEGSSHESDADATVLPAEAHPPIVPAHMHKMKGGKIRVDYYQPEAYKAQTLQQLQEEVDLPEVRRHMRELGKKLILSDRGPPLLPEEDHDATATADADAHPLTPAQEQEQELAAGAALHSW